MEGGAEVGLIQLHRCDNPPRTAHQLPHGDLRVTCCPVAPPAWVAPNHFWTLRAGGAQTPPLLLKGSGYMKAVFFTVTEPFVSDDLSDLCLIFQRRFQRGSHSLSPSQVISWNWQDVSGSEGRRTWAFSPGTRRRK